MNDSIQPQVTPVSVAVVKNCAEQRVVIAEIPGDRAFSEVVRRICRQPGEDPDSPYASADTGSMGESANTEARDQAGPEVSDIISDTIAGLEIDEGPVLSADIAAAGLIESTAETKVWAEPLKAPSPYEVTLRPPPQDHIESSAATITDQTINDSSGLVVRVAAPNAGAGPSSAIAMSGVSMTEHTLGSERVPSRSSIARSAASDITELGTNLGSKPVNPKRGAGVQTPNRAEGALVRDAVDLPADRTAHMLPSALMIAGSVPAGTLHVLATSGDMLSANVMDLRHQFASQTNGRRHAHGEALVGVSIKSAQPGHQKAALSLLPGQRSAGAAATPPDSERQGSAILTRNSAGPHLPTTGLDKTVVTGLSNSPAILLAATQFNEDVQKGLPPDLGLARAADIPVASGSTALTATSLERPALVQIVQASPQPGQSTVEITLSPEELGRVRMSLSNTKGALIVTLSAERPETLDLLRRHVGDLAEQYRAIGYESVDFQFQQQSQHSGHFEQQESKGSVGHITQSDVANAQGFTMTVSQTGVDIRI